LQGYLDASTSAKLDEARRKALAKEEAIAKARRKALAKEEAIAKARRKALAKEEAMRRKIKLENGERVVKELAARSNYYANNCHDELEYLTDPISGLSMRPPRHLCDVDDDLMNRFSRVLGHWGMENGKYLRSMHLTRDMWSSLKEQEKEDLTYWLTTNDVREIILGSVKPSWRHEGNTITVDETVWSKN